MAHQESARSLGHYDYSWLYETAFKSRKEDVDFFLRRAAEAAPGPILEYGAGAGRVTLPLLRAGHEVLAVDASAAMLARLKEHAEQLSSDEQKRLTVRKGDMRKLRLSRQFPVVLATFNVVGHMETHRDMAAFLRCAHAHLAPGGSLIFDVPIPHGDETEADPDELFPVPRFKDPMTKKWVRQTERFEYDPLRQTLLIESEFKVEGMPDSLILPLTLRQWFPKEVEAILEYEGFGEIQSYADYSDNPGLLAGSTLIFQARAL